MEHKKEEIINKDGTRKIVETTTYTEDDGFIPNSLVKGSSYDKEKDQAMFKGYAQNKSFTTDDPRIARVFITLFCLLFLIIGIVLCINKEYIFGFIFIFITIFSFIKSLKDIKKNEEKYLKNPNYNPKDYSVVKDFAKSVKDESKGIIQNKQFQEGANKFKKITIIIFVTLDIIIFIIGLLVSNIKISISILLILLIFELLFIGIVYLITKMKH